MRENAHDPDRPRDHRSSPRRPPEDRPIHPRPGNPNSYNVRLGSSMLTYTAPVIDAHRPNPTRRIEIDPGGYVLDPTELYLGHTLEEVGSDTFVPLLFGRSSVGRLGLFVEITAPIGDIGFHGQWTLMLSPVRPLRVYPGMKIGQIMFFVSVRPVDLYRDKHQDATGPSRPATGATRECPARPRRTERGGGLMILTGPGIAAAVAADGIDIDPYDPGRLSPNSYDWRLGAGGWRLAAGGWGLGAGGEREGLRGQPGRRRAHRLRGSRHSRGRPGP